MISHLVVFICCITASFQWGWNWNNPQPPMANNNLAIGYPTAYGLYAGSRGYGNHGWNNWGGNPPPGAGLGFGSQLRCLNGGAHIGQCRLDKDSICIALGGTCTHGACCTTPFVSMMGGGRTKSPDAMIDGEATKQTGRRITTTTVGPEEESDVIDSKEMEEWNRLVEHAKTSTTQPTTESITVELTSEENYNRKCYSGLRSVGPCADDADCPTLHQCENEQCCYLTMYRI